MNQAVAADPTGSNIKDIAQDIIDSSNINDCTTDQLATLTAEQQTLDQNIE